MDEYWSLLLNVSLPSPSLPPPPVWPLSGWVTDFYPTGSPRCLNSITTVPSSLLGIGQGSRSEPIRASIWWRGLVLDKAGELIWQMRCAFEFSGGNWELLPDSLRRVQYWKDHFLSPGRCHPWMWSLNSGSDLTTKLRIKPVQRGGQSQENSRGPRWSHRVNHHQSLHYSRTSR